MEQIFHSVLIDHERCVGCGACVKDCVAHNLYLQDGKPVCKSPVCMECGHCFAICPVGAVDMPGYDTAECGGIQAMEDFDCDRLLQAMKSRRSIRQFTDAPVEEEKIQRILEAGRFAPTAKNGQGVSYVVIEASLREAENAAAETFYGLQKKAGALSEALKQMKIHENFFFKGGQAAILTISENPVDAALASSYMELMAGSQGLGALYSGYFVTAARLGPSVRRLLELEENEKVVTCLVIGYPAVAYRRTVPRKPVRMRRK